MLPTRSPAATMGGAPPRRPSAGTFYVIGKKKKSSGVPVAIVSGWGTGRAPLTCRPLWPLACSRARPFLAAG